MSRSCLQTLPNRYFVILVRILVFLLSCLTTLFLILPGVSGNRVGFYWLQIEYGSENVWDIGGVGYCKEGTTCGSSYDTPSHYGAIRSLLMFHLASAAIFALNAIYCSILYHFPSAPVTVRYGALMPIFATIFLCIVMISDICVAHRLTLETDVTKVETKGVYWLGTVAFVMSVMWFLTVEYDGHLRRLQVGEELVVEDTHEGKDVVTRIANTAYSWWPWSHRDSAEGNVQSGESSKNSGGLAKGGEWKKKKPKRRK